MDYRETIKGDSCEIYAGGRFTFTDHQAFRPVFKMIEDKKITALTIDLNGVDFIDSAALGILLLLRDETQKCNIGLTLRSPHGQVKKMFDISRFPELFTIIS